MHEQNESNDDRILAIADMNNNNNNAASYDEALAWFITSLINPADLDYTKLQKIGKYLGLSFGAASGVIAGPLAYAFSHFLTNNLHIDNSKTEIILSIFAGSTAAAAIMALSARLASIVAINLLAKTPEIKKQFRRVNYQWEDLFQYSYLTLTTTIGSLSGSPTIYITNKFFSKYIGPAAIIIDIPTALSLAVVRSWALEKVASGLLRPILTPIHDRILGREKALTKQMRSFILKQLAITTQKINGISDAEANQLLHKIYGDDHKIKNIIYLFDSNQFNSRTVTQPANMHSKLKSATGFLGALIGFITPFSSYPLGKAAANAFCDLVGIEDKDFREHFARTVGTCSYIGLSCLAAFATKNKFEEFYKWCARFPQNITKLFSSEGRSSIAVKLVILDMLVLFISACSATPRAELNRETVDTDQFYAPIVIIAALISGFATDYWALDEFINEYFQKRTTKQSLIALVNQMMADITLMDAQYVRAIMDVIAPNDASNLINNPVKPIYHRNYKGIFFKSENNSDQNDELETKRLLSANINNDPIKGEPEFQGNPRFCGII